MKTYEETANELLDRILKLVPAHPEILEITNSFDLFKIDGFKCDDLEPSLGQAQWALSTAKKRFEKENR